MLGSSSNLAPKPWTLWDFQGETVEKVERCPSRRVLVRSPTGSGKTMIAMELMYRAYERGETSMFMAPRHELLRQAAKKLDLWLPLSYGMITARTKGEMDLYQPVQVSSVDTLVSRVVKRQRLVLPPIANVFVDEAHLYVTRHRQALMELFPTAKRIIGFTATPGRGDGKGMGILFEELITAATEAELTRRGYLVPVKYRAPSEPDLKKARELASKRGRDFTDEETDAAMLPLVGDIPETWLREAPDRRTIVFANSVGNSVWLAKRFRELGVAAEHCDGTADADTRDGIFGRFESGETQVFCNVDLATYGYDLPAVSCIVDAAPTTSIVDYMQKIGRGVRLEPQIGKRDLLYLCHSGNVREHGFITEDRYWTLSGGKAASDQGRKKLKSGDRERKELHLRCPRCTLVFGGALTCPDCGYYFERTAKAFRVLDGDLVALERPDPAAEMEKRQFYAELLSFALLSGYKPGWASYAYQEKYKTMPPREWQHFKPAPVSVATDRFCKYLRIRRGRSKAKGNA